MIFFIGNIYKNDYIKRNNHLSAAASSWLNNFFKKINYKIKLVSFLPKRPFPVGELYVQENNFSKFRETKYIDYLNLPFVKEKIIKIKILKEINRCRSNRTVIFTYNFPKIVFSVLDHIKNKNIFWISICADYNIRDQKKIFKKLKNSDLNIFLSKFSFDSYKYKNKIFFNGFQKVLGKKIKVKKIRNFLYSGSLDNWTGINYFLDDFIKIKNDDVKFLITSNSNSLLIKKYLADKRIKFLGFLNDFDYQKILKKTDCYVNLRNTKDMNNLNNFPSKLLYYTPYCKPIISTSLKNLDPKLEKILISDKDNNYYKLLKNLINLDPVSISKLSNKISKYNKEKKKEDLLFLKKIKQLIKDDK